MTVEQRPILRDADHDKDAYSAFAAAQFRILKDYMKVAKLNTYSRVVTLANGVVITCQKSFNREDIFISVPPQPVPIFTTDILTVSGVICHPRSGVMSLQDVCYYDWTGFADYYSGSFLTRKVMHVYGVAGGWRNGTTPLQSVIERPGSTDYPPAGHAGPYPISDSDYASFAKISATSDTGTQIEKVGFTQPGVYGNLYWDNGAKYDSKSRKWDKNRRCVSWKGTPTRHFRVGNLTEIPTLSRLDTVFSFGFLGDDYYGQYHTTFNTQVYADGKVLYTAPRFSWPQLTGETEALILGATDKYIITQDNHYQAPSYYFSFSDGHTIITSDAGKATTYVTEQNSLYPNANPKLTLLFRYDIKKPGFYLGVWTRKQSTDEYGVVRKDRVRLGGWELVAEYPYSREGLPWFANSDGDKFVCSNGKTVEITESKSGKALSFASTYSPTARVVVPGTYLETPTTGVFTVAAYVPENPIYFEYKYNEVTNLAASYSFDSATPSAYHHTMSGLHKLEVGGVSVPLLRTSRVFAGNYSYLDNGHAGASSLSDVYEITTSKVHYIDLRYGVVVFKTVKETISINVNSAEEANFKGPWGPMYFCQLKIKGSDFTATRSIEWHMLIDGMDKIISTTTYGLDPFPDALIPSGLSATELNEYLVNGYYVTLGGSLPLFNPDTYIPDQDVRQLVCIPTPPSLGIPWTDDLRFFGFYDYGHNPYLEEYSALNEADGGNKDFFFPEWLRNMQPNWIMTETAAKRFMINWWHGPTQDLRSEYLPAMTEDPIPIGNFVRHPVYGDYWQFLCDNSYAAEVVQSDSLTELKPLVDIELGKTDDADGNPLTTHDKTLYYPLGII